MPTKKTRETMPRNDDKRVARAHARPPNSPCKAILKYTRSKGVRVLHAFPHVGNLHLSEEHNGNGACIGDGVTCIARMASRHAQLT